MAQHPRDIDPQALRDNLFQSAIAISEMARYEAALADADVNLALAGLAEHDTRRDAMLPLFPAVRAAVEAQLTARMIEAGRRRESIRLSLTETIVFDTAPRNVPAARAEVERCDRFAQDPGRYLPGAEACLLPVVASGVIEGFVTIGRDRRLPWILSPCGVGPSAVEDAAEFYGRHRHEAVIVVGSHLHDGVTLPAGVVFVEVR
ncbi:hypothetical protein ASF52_05770 [Methylobacterium sp. Leaf112]|nr:hypothetical protein ASF52_05770 [Methylobacterium sp. Leaf112]